MEITVIAEIIEKWGVMPLMVYIIMQQLSIAKQLKSTLPVKMEFLKSELDKLRKSIEIIARQVNCIERESNNRTVDDEITITEIIAANRNHN